MKAAGIGIQKIEVYRNLPVLKRLSNSFGVYLFFSPGGAANFAESGNHIPDSASVVAIGETTAGICRKLFGREVFVSKYQDELAAVKFASGLLKTKEDLIPVII
jgi:uroporphyrinogen-III synthase